jgi:hypothetical protein
MAEYETQYQALGTCDDEETDEAPSNDGDFMIHVETCFFIKQSYHTCTNKKKTLKG